MAEFLQSISLLPIALTLGAYQVGLWCRKKWNHPIVNPLLIAVILIIGFLLLTGLPLETYQAGTAGLSWLLTPVTVCLAVPLYEQVRQLKKNLPAIAVGVAAGAVTSVLVVLLMAWLFRLDRSLTVSLLPKSATSAMSMVLSEQAGGIGTLTTAVSILSGVQGALMGNLLCKLLKLTHPIAQGVALGTASHVVGTTKATELGALQGAVSSLSLALSGILTAILMPLALLLVQ
jgi:predicted murein hydrolase (TIGR00659 family)